MGNLVFQKYKILIKKKSGWQKYESVLLFYFISNLVIIFLMNIPVYINISMNKWKIKLFFYFNLIYTIIVFFKKSY